jgi:hypothetical protein
MQSYGRDLSHRHQAKEKNFATTGLGIQFLEQRGVIVEKFLKNEISDFDGSIVYMGGNPFIDKFHRFIYCLVIHY